MTLEIGSPALCLSIELERHASISYEIGFIKEGNLMIINHNLSSINANNVLTFKVRDTVKMVFLLFKLLKDICRKLKT